MESLLACQVRVSNVNLTESLCLSRNSVHFTWASNFWAYNVSQYSPIVLFISVISNDPLPVLVLVMSLFFSWSVQLKDCQFLKCFSEKQLLVLFIFAIIFLFLSSFIPALIFISSFLLLTLAFICSCFSIFLRWKFQLLFEIFLLFNVDMYSFKHSISKALYLVLSFLFTSEYFLIFLLTSSTH